ncbi:hypothetical protein LTR67_009150 [Exophiala xenobiotica]
MDISSLVYAVVAAFEDAIKLVQRIRDQRESSNGASLPEEPTRDLLESLALGPAIVRGHYQHDLKRFGEQYACGDIQAREQMKDILINLQMTLIITLRNVYMDNMDLDFNALQTSSDDCRVNAGVCLGQLSQRLAEAARAHAHHPASMSYSSGSGLMPPMSPSLGYSSSRSTHSSTGPQAPRTPDTIAEQFGHLNVSHVVHPPHLGRKMSGSPPGSLDFYGRQPVRLPESTDEHRSIPAPVGVCRVDDSDRMSMRRRSSQALAPDDNILMLFPQPGGQSAADGTDRESMISPDKNNQLADISRSSSRHRCQDSRDRYGPDDYNGPVQFDYGTGVVRNDGRQYSNSTVYDMYNPPPTPEQQRHTSSNSNSYSSRAQASNHGTLEHVRYLQENSRAPNAQPPRSDSLNAPRKRENAYDQYQQYRQPSRSQTASPMGSSMPYQQQQPRPIGIGMSVIPRISQNDVRLAPTAPLPPPPPGQPPLLSHSSSQPVSLTPTLPWSRTTRNSGTGSSSIHTMASSSSTPSIVPPPIPAAFGPLILPTDKDTLGFCKGAFRLQAGLERKAFSLANRPTGFTGTVTYWRCEKCNFEGPVYTSVNVSGTKKKGKPERTFDPKIRVSETGGVRYKWAFLAKCHVNLKGMVPLGEAGSREGSFGSFGCVFCCAEGKYRRWNDSSAVWASSTNGVDKGVMGLLTSGKGKHRGSVRSGKSGHTANLGAKVDSSSGASQSTPIFGNVASFMEHLETVHREQDGWPNAEMQGRFSVVVGRLAGVHEEGWDVNFVPF